MKHKAATNPFRLKPLVAAMSLALAPTAAMAVLPADGTVVQGNVSASGIVGDAQTITMNTTNAVIRWGDVNDTPTINTATGDPAGFNISNGASLTFSAAATSNVLNIDASGNASFIQGALTGTNTRVFVANANGVTVSDTAVITAPRAGFIAADMNSNALITDFFNNGILTMDFATAGGAANVASGADLSGVNDVLIAGSGVVNVTVDSTTRPVDDFDIVGGVGSQYDVATTTLTAYDQGAAQATSAATDVNVTFGTVANPVDPNNGPIAIWANGDLNSAGVMNDDVSNGSWEWTGVWNNSADFSGNLGEFNYTQSDGQVSWYNNDATRDNYGSINNSGIISGTYVNIRARGLTNSGTIQATDLNQYVRIRSYGPDNGITNSGTIQATAASGYVWLQTGQGSGTRSGDIVNTATGTIAAPEYIELQAQSGGGDITNAGALNITNLAGEVYMTTSNGSVTVGGTVAGVGQTVGIDNYLSYFEANAGNDGDLTITTPIDVQTADAGDTGIELVFGGDADISGALTVASDNIQAPGDVYVNGFNRGVVAVNADITAGDVEFQGPWSDTRNLDVALNADITTTWDPDNDGYASFSLYQGCCLVGPGVITANNLWLEINGNMRNPVSQQDFRLNGLQVTTIGDDPYLELNVVGETAQFLNIAVTGDLTVSSGSTDSAVAPFDDYRAVNNAQSSLIINASGDLTVVPGWGDGLSDEEQGSVFPGNSEMYEGNAFHFPGGVVFIAGGSLEVIGTVDNAWNGDSVNPIAFQGMFFESDTITMDNELYTNANNWVNYSSAAHIPPAVNVGVETVNQLGEVTFSAQLDPDASKINTWTAIVDAAVNPANPAYPDWASVVDSTPFYGPQP